MRKALFLFATVALFAAGAFAAGAANAADHKDAPANASDPGADGTDVYFFRSPNNNANAVFVLGVGPLIAPAEAAMRGFDPQVTYAINIDRTGDNVADARVTIRAAGTNQFIIEGLGAPITANATPAGAAPVINRSGDISVFAGMRDDPFFFDLAGFTAFKTNPAPPVSGLRSASGGTATDNFAGTNVNAIVMELPITMITGGSSANTGTVKLVAQTLRSGRQVDRIAIPAVNTAVVPMGKNDAFNNAPVDTSQDVAMFKADITNTITGLRTAVDGLLGGPSTQGGGPLGSMTPDQIASILVPYIATVDFSKPLVFPNGRRLQDDVIDAALGLVLNRGGATGVSDGVNANDKAFLGTFPYLADPWTTSAGSAVATTMPPPLAGVAPAASNAAGIPVMIPPRTGDGGLLQDTSTMWTASALFFALAVGLGGAGSFMAMRNRSR